MQMTGQFNNNCWSTRWEYSSAACCKMASVQADLLVDC